MSQGFQTVLIKDDRIANITDEIKYGVKKGAQNVTVYPYKAISASNSAITFNIQVPNRTTILDRRIMLKATVTVKVDCPPAANVGDLYILPGNNFGLGPFPVQSLFSTMSMTINSNTVTINIADVLPALMTMLDSRELSRYNGATPIKRDSYLKYTGVEKFDNSPFAGWDKCVDPDLANRGSFHIDSILGNVSTDTTTAGTVTFTFTSYEPLLLSPLIWGNPKMNNQGMYGITNLTFLFNVGSANRVVRTSAVINDSSVTAGQIKKIYLDPAGGFNANSTNLYITYLSPHPSDLLPSKNIVGYLDLPRYISSGQPTIPQATYSLAKGLQPGTATFTSQSLQLNQIPDKLMIFVRQQAGTILNNTPDHFYPIRSININWNNQSGLLSSFSQYDLFRASADAGSNLAWNEFVGSVLVSPASITSGSMAVANAGTTVLTVGSCLVLDMGRTIQLINDFDAPGSIGSYNLQFNVVVENWDTSATATGADVVNAELVLITVNSGIMVLENGSSSILTAILDKQTVLETSEQEPYSHSAVARQVGGGFLDSLKSIGKALLPVAKALAPVARGALGQSSNPLAMGADSALKMLGLGMSGGAPSGGARSGGLRRKIH
jgi:hypothetical protein